MIILGIDPGTAATGYGIIKNTKISAKELGRNKRKNKAKNVMKCITYGVIRTDRALPDAQRLKTLYNQLNLLIEKYKPKLIAVEKLYFFKNLKTAIPVSQAKGVILLAAAKKKIQILEFTPLQTKAAVTGYGRALKPQIQKKIKVLLNLKEIPRPDDAADALGVAVCCVKVLKKRF